MLALLFDSGFWYDLIAIAFIGFIIFLCFKYPNSRVYVFSFLGIIFVGITAYCGIQLNYYYTAEGGVWGYITGMIENNTATIEIMDTAKFTLNNIVLTQDKDNTYSATIYNEDLIKFKDNVNYGVYVNGEPCSQVDYSTNYIRAEYGYTFMNDNLEELMTDTLQFNFAFFDKSSQLKITTNGGQTAVNYWNNYFARNNFIVEVKPSSYDKNNDLTFGDGDVSEYRTLNYYVEDNVYQEIVKYGSNISVPKYINQQTTGVLYFDKELTEKIDIDTFKVTDNIDIYTQKATLDKLEFATTTAGVVYTISLKPGATGDVVLPNQYQDSVSLIISDFSNSEISSVTVSEKVIGISASSFKGCSNLTEINVVEENANFSSINGVLYNKEQTKLIYYPLGKSTEEILLPTSVVEIGEYCFYDNSKLQTFDFTNILKINDYAFYKTGLTGSLKLYATLIGASAFENSDKIETLQFYSNGTISIEDKAFKGCMLLETVYFRGQSDLSYVGSDVFTAVEEVRILTDTATNLFIQLTSFDSFGGLISKINKIYIDKDLFDNNQNEFLKNQDNFTRSLSGAFYILTRV